MYPRSSSGARSCKRYGDAGCSYKSESRRTKGRENSPARYCFGPECTDGRKTVAFHVTNALRETAKDAGRDDDKTGCQEDTIRKVHREQATFKEDVALGRSPAKLLEFRRWSHASDNFREPHGTLQGQDEITNLIDEFADSIFPEDYALPPFLTKTSSPDPESPGADLYMEDLHIQDDDMPEHHRIQEPLEKSMKWVLDVRGKIIDFSKLPVATQTELERIFQHFYSAKDEVVPRYSDADAKRHKVFTTMVRNQHKHADSGRCVNNIVWNRSKDPMKFTKSNQDTAKTCDACFNKGSICTRIITDRDESKLCLYALPDDRQVDKDWRSVRFWINKT
ncbi:hypothetical protein BDV95DRAFT_612008 [Massariosphaeria phaeospora]|uniref:Uncharacterized protein n=1 Tax=Massariosphaeria phaeospora TaxID=100035 RepID=A0A7C8M2K4_9PLEO|nr:hypothetical protein BDV95DRAFT_612008 [Massariosphaeria phaeospora]